MAGASLPLLPIMTLTEKSELLSVALAPDADSGAFGAAIFGAFLYAYDASGSTSTRVLVASLDNTVSSVTAWAPFRAKTMTLVPGKSVIDSGTTLALYTQYGAGSTKDWRGGITMRFRRLN